MTIAWIIRSGRLWLESFGHGHVELRRIKLSVNEDEELLSTLAGS